MFAYIGTKMDVRAQLEAAVAGAEANWRAAYKALALAKMARDGASAAWDKARMHRRAAAADGGKACMDTNARDRRVTATELAALSKRASARLDAYLCQAAADAAYQTARAGLITAARARQTAIASLLALDHEPEANAIAQGQDGWASINSLAKGIRKLMRPAGLIARFALSPDAKAWFP